VTITILTDNSKSWFIPYGKILESKLYGLGHEVLFVNSKKQIETGDICFLLSCSRIVEQEYLNRNNHNIVVHASDLPEGKGFSPLQWQILEGKDEITLTLFEAADDVDAGPYYIKDEVRYHGTELYSELREKLALKIIEMCVEYINGYKTMKPKKQYGEESFYRKRRKEDDEIDPYDTIENQFNHFRIADNDNYPLYFHFRGEKYYLKVYKEKPSKLIKQKPGQDNTANKQEMK